MKELKEILEGVFDKDLIEKDPIDLSYFKIKNPNERYDIFFILDGIMNTPEIESLPEWMIEEYYKHQPGYDFILQSFYDAFNKQHCSTWVNITENDFEEMGDGMTDEEIDQANQDLQKYFSKTESTDRGGYFVVGKGKIPDFIIKILKDSDNWKSQFSNIKEWAIEYYQDSYDCSMTFYGCPKGLNSTVKKLLYE